MQPLSRTERRVRLLRVAALWWTLDVLAATLGALGAYELRFHALTAFVPVTKGIPPLNGYLLGGLALGLLWTLAFRNEGLYDPRGRSAGSTNVARLVRGSLVGTALAGAVSFFYRGFSFSRLVLPLTWLVGLPVAIAFRWIADVLLRRVVREPWTRVAVAGSGPLARQLAGRLARRSPVGHTFVGLVGPTSSHTVGATPDLTPHSGARRNTTHGDLPLLGDVRELEALVARHDINHLLLALSPAGDPSVLGAAARLHAAGVEIEFVPETADLLPASPVVSVLDGVPLIGLRESPLVGWKIAAKRACDVVVSGAALLFLSPVFAILALLIRADSAGPVFYAQSRVGRDLRTFTLYKFRTMHVNAEGDGTPRHARRDDPRRTRVGRVLRRFSLDELPQLWNVLLGDMSLVGPRPERPTFVKQFEKTIPDYFLRHRVKSGLTGWAQIHDLRGDAPFEERTRYDLYYIEHWSLALDLRIVARTVGAVLGSRHAI
jgi:exopolysaccharide biosynthesis polyprenyl glycosylphosphotransferase